MTADFDSLDEILHQTDTVLCKSADWIATLRASQTELRARMTASREAIRGSVALLKERYLEQQSADAVRAVLSKD